MICSINYWSNGNGKILDLYVLKISGIIYFIYGNYYITENKIKSLGYLNTFCLLNCYSISNILYDMNSDAWIFFYILFNFFVSFNKILVIMYT